METFEFCFASDREMDVFLEGPDVCDVLKKDPLSHIFLENDHRCVVRTTKKYLVTHPVSYGYPYGNGRFQEAAEGIVVRHLDFFLEIWHWSCLQRWCSSSNKNFVVLWMDSILATCLPTLSKNRLHQSRICTEQLAAWKLSLNCKDEDLEELPPIITNIPHHPKTAMIEEYLLKHVPSKDDRLLIVERLIHQVCNIYGWSRAAEGRFLYQWGLAHGKRERKNKCLFCWF